MRPATWAEAITTDRYPAAPEVAPQPTAIRDLVDWNGHPPLTEAALQAAAVGWSRRVACGPVQRCPITGQRWLDPDADDRWLVAPTARTARPPGASHFHRGAQGPASTRSNLPAEEATSVTARRAKHQPRRRSPARFQVVSSPTESTTGRASSRRPPTPALGQSSSPGTVSRAWSRRHRHRRADRQGPMRHGRLSQAVERTARRASGMVSAMPAVAGAVRRAQRPVVHAVADPTGLAHRPTASTQPSVAGSSIMRPAAQQWRRGRDFPPPRAAGTEAPPVVRTVRAMIPAPSSCRGSTVGGTRPPSTAAGRGTSTVVAARPRLVAEPAFDPHPAPDHPDRRHKPPRRPRTCAARRR